MASASSYRNRTTSRRWQRSLESQSASPLLRLSTTVASSDCSRRVRSKAGQSAPIGGFCKVLFRLVRGAADDAAARGTSSLDGITKQFARPPGRPSHSPPEGEKKATEGRLFSEKTVVGTWSREWNGSAKIRGVARSSPFLSLICNRSFEVFAAALLLLHFFTLNRFIMKSFSAALLSILLFSCCASPQERMADEIMADIQSGKFRYLTTPGGPLLYDSKMRISHRVVQHLLKVGTSEADYQRVFEYQPRVFQLPNIISYTKTMTTTGEIDLSISGDTVPELYPEHRSYYRVQSPFGASNIQVCLAKLGADQGWKVVAVFQE